MHKRRLRDGKKKKSYTIPTTNEPQQRVTFQRYFNDVQVNFGLADTLIVIRTVPKS